MKLKITLLVLGGIAWANALSAVFAIGFWAKIYDGLLNRLDLTYTQVALLIPVISITLCFLTGIASVFYLVKSIKSKKLFSASSENLAGLFCLSAFLFYTVLNIGDASTFAQMVSNVHIEQARSAVYESGQVLNGQYVNESYGFGFQIPNGWSKASWASMERKKGHATFSLFSLWGKSISLTNLVPQHVEGIDTLAAIFKNSPETENYNPSLVINANDKQLLQQKYGVGSLFNFATMLAKAPRPFVVDQFPTPISIANKTAFKLKIISNRNGDSISENVFVFEIGSSYLEFVASTIDDGDAANLLACLHTIKFTK